MKQKKVKKTKLDIFCKTCNECNTVSVNDYKERVKFDSEVEKFLTKKNWSYAGGYICPKCNEKNATIAN